MTEFITPARRRKGDSPFQNAGSSRPIGACFRIPPRLRILEADRRRRKGTVPFIQKGTAPFFLQTVPQPNFCVAAKPQCQGANCAQNTPVHSSMIPRILQMVFSD